MEGLFTKAERERLIRERDEALATVDALTERAERAEAALAEKEQARQEAVRRLGEVCDEWDKLKQERDEALTDIGTLLSAAGYADDDDGFIDDAASRIRGIIALADARGRALESIRVECFDPSGNLRDDLNCDFLATVTTEAISLPAPEALRQQREREAGLLVNLATLRRALENELDFLNECASDAEDDKLFGFSDATKAITEALEATPLAILKRQQEREAGKDALIERLRDALEKHGSHNKDCALGWKWKEDGNTCDCGFDTALSLAAPDTRSDHETQATITRWAKDTFGEPLSLLQIWERMMDEMMELRRAMVEGRPEKIAEECADTYIVLCQIPERLGYNLQDAVDRKMKINRGRKWKTNGDGTGQHIE